MTWFHYKALARNSAVIKGEMEAASQAAVIDWLLGQGHTPISVMERGAPKQARFGDTPRILRSDERVRITRELASLINAGVSVERALLIVAQLVPRTPVRQLLSQIIERIREGQSFARALEASPGTFPAHYLGLVAAGEASGTLPRNLDRLASSLERAQKLSERVRSALLYPAVLMIMICVTFVLIFTVVLPRLEPLFADAGAALPIATQIVLSLGRFVDSYGWLLLIAIAVVGLVGLELSRLPVVKVTFDRFLLGFPPLLGLILKSETASFSLTLGTLLDAGISMPVALGRTQQAVRNHAMKKAIGRALTAVREGERLSLATGKTRILPRAVLELMRVGEEIAALPEMLFRASDLYERDLEVTIDRLVTLLVPTLTIVMGVLVGGLVASVLIGIMSLNEIAL